MESKDQEILESLLRIYQHLSEEKKKQFARRVSLGDLISDRWENARAYGFGEGTSCYDNVLILGDVKVGEHTWIGPNVVLDGSGYLEIGSHCSISSGVQIYSHDSVKKAVSMGQYPMEHAPTKIGSGVYIGPQSVIQKGVTIGDRVIIGAMSFVNADVPSDTRVAGCPAKRLRSKS